MSEWRRLVGIPPTSGAAFIDNIGRIRKALNEKGGTYAGLDEPLGNPLIIAANSGSVFFEDDDADQALFGSAAFTYRRMFSSHRS